MLTIEHSTKSDVENITLRAVQFVKTGLKWTREWSIKDWVDCEVLDIDAKFLPDLFTFTDLDNDGIVETTLSYSMICTGDVSPKLIKTIMREGGDKYAVRGESLVRIGKDIRSGGTFKTDDSLNAIPVFKDHLPTIWKIAAGISSHPKDKK